MSRGLSGHDDGVMTTTTDASPVIHDRLVTPAFVRLFLADLAYFTAAGVAIYALPQYVTGPVGSDKAGAGIAFGAFAVTALVLRPFAGRLADTWGRRPLLVGGALLCGTSMLLTAFADNLPLVVALRLALGIAEAAFFVASVAALVDLAPPSRMGEALSYNSLGLYLGIALGPPLGEVLVEQMGFAPAWYAAAALSLLAAAIVMRIGETRAHHSAADPPAGLIHWPAVPAAAGFLTSVVAMGGFLTFASLHAEEVGLANTSLPLFVYGMVVVTCRIVFARVPDRVSSLPLGAAALVTIGAGLGVMTLWAAPIGVLAGAAVMAVGVAFSTPAFFSAIFATASPSQRGAASGTASAMLDLGLGGGPIMLGLVAETAGLLWAFGVAAAVALVGSCWTWSLSTRRPSARVPGQSAAGDTFIRNTPNPTLKGGH
jgi:predicted MFS family arabinose efflux permease